MTDSIVEILTAGSSVVEVATGTPGAPGTGADPAEIEAAIEDYLTDNPVTTPDATSLVKGVVQLAGDLGGTAASPTVPGLSGKSNVGHSHAESDVTGLTTALAGKSATGHTHAEADVTGLTAALAAKADASATTTALAGKASTSHTHAEGDVTGLTAALAGKSATGHTHTAANVSDFNTAADARVELGHTNRLGLVAPPVNSFFAGHMTYGATAAAGALNAALPSMLVVPPCDMSIDQVSVNVTTLQAATSCKVFILDSDSNGAPSTTILATVTADCSGTGVKDMALGSPLALEGGKNYWCAVIANGGTARLRGVLQPIPTGTAGSSSAILGVDAMAWVISMTDYTTPVVSASRTASSAVKPLVAFRRSA